MVRPHLSCFTDSVGLIFCSLQKKKKKEKVGTLLLMCTSTNLHRCDAVLLEEDIHGFFKMITHFFTRHLGHNLRWEIHET